MGCCEAGLAEGERGVREREIIYIYLQRGGKGGSEMRDFFKRGRSIGEGNRSVGRSERTGTCVDGDVGVFLSSRRDMGGGLGGDWGRMKMDNG